MIIHGDGIPSDCRTLCYVKWQGKRTRCFGWYQKTEECMPILRFSQHSLPGMDTKYHTHDLTFDASNLMIRTDPSKSAALVCDVELDGDREIRKTE